MAKATDVRTGLAHGLRMDTTDLSLTSPRQAIPAPGVVLTGLFLASATMFAVAPDSLVTAGWFAVIALVLPAAQRAGR